MIVNGGKNKYSQSNDYKSNIMKLQCDQHQNVFKC
jgi:hypothetical protein